MRKIREVLRLKFDAGLSVRKITISRGSVGNYLHRFNACGLTWPTVLQDAELGTLSAPASADGFQ